MSNKKNDLEREQFSGLILPWLNHLYKLFLDRIIEKHNLKIDKEFWFFLSLGVFSLIIYFTGINIWVPLGLFFGALLILLLHNNSYIRKKLFPRQSEEIEDFLSNIKSKSNDDILNFIKNYPLETNQIIQIIQIKKDKYDIYLFIDKYQSIKSELLEYMIEEKIQDIMGEDLFCKFLLHSKEHISKNKYELLLKSKNDKKILKTINLCYPFYLKKHQVFKFFANLIIKVRNSFNYGTTKFIIFLASMIIVLLSIKKDPSVLTIKTQSTLPLITQLINNVLAFLIISSIITIIINYVISLLLRLFRYITYLSAPDTKE